MQDIHIVASTWFPPGPVGVARAASTMKAIESWNQRLMYKGNMILHIADDGTPGDRFREFLNEVTKHNFRFEKVIYTTGNRKGIGASLNRGCHMAFEQNAQVFFAQDDWALTAQIDLTPWAELLEVERSLCIMRLGPPHPWLTGRIEFHPPQGWFMRLDKHHYVYGMRPALYHARMFYYREFMEGVSAMECERLYNENICKIMGGGPSIGLALPDPWAHVGDAEIGDIQPGKESKNEPYRRSEGFSEVTGDGNGG